jgi:glycosyltransferase involved in cell wall biosynthesis
VTTSPVTHGSITYLCLQPMRQGQASYAHVNEIANGLRLEGWSVRIVSTPATGSDGLWRRLWVAIRVQATLFTHRSPDVIYVRAHPAAIFYCAWARARGIPVVQEVNGPGEDFAAAWPVLQPLLRIIAISLRWQLRSATAVITVTEGLRAWAEQSVGGRSPVVVVPNAADPMRFAPASGPSCPPYVIFFGALAPWQGIGTLLEAAVDEAWPADVTLVVAGDGPHRGDVEALARECPRRVSYVGSVPYGDIPALISHSLAAVIPKDYHRADLGLSPLKLYEAMACQVPVVVTDLPGLGDVVRAEKCGIVVQPRAAHEVAAAVGLLQSDPELAQQLGRRGRTAVLERHSWSHRARRTSEVTAGALSARGARSHAPTPAE